MGVILSTLPLANTQSLANISPSRADWLTSHADATGLAVVEVERLWNRFKQLTGSHDRTQLDPDHIDHHNELAKDIFVKNLLKHFPRSSTDGGSIPFGYFLVVMQYIESASIPDKLSGIFYYLNNGEPLNAAVLTKLLKHVYPETKENDLKVLAQQFMQQLGSDSQGQLNHQQFVSGVQRFIPAEDLEELLHFDLIPPQLLDEANMLPSLQSSSTNLHGADYSSNDLVSDDQLRQVASHAARKNWSRLALTLGFLEYDIEAYKVQNNNDAAATMYELLRTWREQESGLATKGRLKHCLRESGLEDLVKLLN